MNQTKRSLRLIGIFSLAFIMSGVLHIALYGVDFANTIVQLYSAVVVLLWGFSLRERITNKVVLLFLYGIVFLMEVMSLAQAGRYALFLGDSVGERYCWYAYYVPFIFVPVFFSQVAFRLNVQKGDKPKQWWKFLDMPSIVLFFLVATNDIHQIVFRFPQGLANGVRKHNYGVSFYLIWVLVIVQNLVALVIIVKKCKVNASRRMLWLPAFFEAIFIAGQLMFFTDSFIRINGALIWNQGEFYIFAMIGLTESCIAMGLIPANVGYRKLFRLADDMAVIHDKEGNIIISSKEAEAFLGKKGVVVSVADIPGGMVSYGVDMGPVYALNQSLEEENKRIEARNKIIESTNELESEKSRLEASNELYDRISLIVRPKLDKIQELMDSSTDEDFKDKLSLIAVYNAYIKRRSNLELLNDGSSLVDIKEFTTAVFESLEYVKLVSKDSMLSSSVTGKLPGEMLILFYEFFEEVMEKSLDSLKSMFVTFTRAGDAYRLKLQIDCDGDVSLSEEEAERFSGFSGQFSFLSEKESRTATLVMRAEGGDM